MYLSALVALCAAHFAHLATPVPHATTILGRSTLFCSVATARELHARRHAFACVNLDDGDVAGAFLTPGGKIACRVTGTWDGTCLTLEACGHTERSC